MAKNSTLNVAAIAAMFAVCLLLSSTGASAKGKPVPSNVRIIQFAGLDWSVKHFEDGRVGPGPNYFSDDPDNVWVDGDGRLHLAIKYRDNRWYSAEVISRDSFGYGTYRWYIDSPVDDLTSNVVIGLFTWNDRPRYNHREIDIEFAYWNDPQHPGGQYVVQPWDMPGNLTTFAMPAALTQSTHQFSWSRKQVFFESITGQQPSPSSPTDVVAQFLYAGDGVPRAGGENARMNVWLFRGEPPADGRPFELVVSGFEFVPG